MYLGTYIMCKDGGIITCKTTNTTLLQLPLTFIAWYKHFNNKLQVKLLLWDRTVTIMNKGNNKITELRTILQRENQNS